MKYYFLVTYLPEIQRDDKKLRVRFADLMEERELFAPRDWREIELLLLQADIFLLEKLLRGKDVDVEHALYPKEYWKEQVKSPKEVPAFLETYFQTVSPDAFGPRDVDRLYETYYEHVLDAASTELLKDYTRFQLDLRNVLAGLRARNKGLTPSEHTVGTGEVVEQIGTSNAEDFGLGQEHPWVERLVAAKDPLQLEDTIEQITWEFLDERTQQMHFEFEIVLAYILKLQLVEKRLALSEEQGMEIVRQLEGL